MNLFNSKAILREKRQQWIDYDKGISIILVGFGHCLFTLQSHMVDINGYPALNYLATFLYGFRMPLFFIISGLLVGRSLNKKGLNNYVADRTNNILYPLVVWGIIEISIQVLSAKLSPYTAHGGINPYKYIALIIDPRETGHFWYLNALFCIGTIYALVKQRLAVGHGVQLVIGSIFFCGSAYIQMHDLSAWLFTDVFQYYIFFAIGDLLSNVLLDGEARAQMASWKIFIPQLIAFFIVQYYFTEINLRPSKEGIQFVQYKMPFFFLFEALLGCALSINISFLLQKYGAAKWLRVIGYHSLFIYCMQMITMDFIRIGVNRVLHITNIPALVFLVWVGGVLLPIAFYNLCIKYQLWWLYTYKRPKQTDIHETSRATVELN